MAVTVTSTISGPYFPNGATTVFAFDFKAGSASEIQVYRDLGEDEWGLVPSADYTVSVDPDQEGGDVEFSVAPVTGSGDLYIVSEPLFTREGQYTGEGPFTPKGLNNQFDRAAVRDLALARDVGRSIKFPLGEESLVLPRAALRAGKFLSFGPDGITPIFSEGTGADLGLRTDLADLFGAGMVGFDQEGVGAIGETVRDALRRINVYAEQFGAVGDGETDDTVALTRFWNSAIANPGTPHILGSKTYCVSDLLPKITAPNVIIRGHAHDIHDGGALQLTGTRLKWIGGVNAGPLVDVGPIESIANGRLAGLHLVGIGIDCDAVLGIGFRGSSFRNSDIDLAILNATNVGCVLMCASTLAEAADLQKNRIRLQHRQIEAPNGLCLELLGTATANVSGNRFHFTAQHANAHCVSFQNSDNNVWEYYGTFCVGTATYSGVLYGSNGGAEAGARGEQFLFLSGNRSLYCHGTSDATTPTKWHRVFFRDVENGTPAPVLGEGATIDDQNWNAWSPAVTATGGTGFAVTVNTSLYRVWMGQIDYVLQFSVSAAGTGNTHITATLPRASVGGPGSVSVGKERAVSGKLLMGYQDGGSNVLTIDNYDGTYCGVNGGVYIVRGSYRI